MWYVVQVRTGSEQSMIQQCQKLIPEEVMARCFVPYYEEKRCIQGEWKMQKNLLFPGYIFVITDHIQELHEQLRQVIGFTKMIGVGEEIVSLKQEEINSLESFGGERQIVGMSEGVIEYSKVIIHFGPLQGKDIYGK